MRFKPHITAAVRRVADGSGISFNAALSVLLTEALRARGELPGGASDRAARPAADA